MLKQENSGIVAHSFFLSAQVFHPTWVPHALRKPKILDQFYNLLSLLLWWGHPALLEKFISLCKLVSPQFYDLGIFTSFMLFFWTAHFTILFGEFQVSITLFKPKTQNLAVTWPNLLFHKTTEATESDLYQLPTLPQPLACLYLYQSLPSLL